MQDKIKQLNDLLYLKYNDTKLKTYRLELPEEMTQMEIDEGTRWVDSILATTYKDAKEARDYLSQELWDRYFLWDYHDQPEMKRWKKAYQELENSLSSKPAFIRRIHVREK